MDLQFIPASRMQERARLARDESDTAYFYDMLFFGEFVIKVLVVEILAALQEDTERHKYSLEYRIVRANGIGEWADVLDEALTGPASQHLINAGRESQRAILTLVGTHDPGWQRHAVDRLNAVCRCLDGSREDLSRQKVSLRNWMRNFVWIRNRTRGHGAPQAATLSTVCPDLSKSLTAVVQNAPAFQRSWAHVRRNLSGKYRVSSFGGLREPFAYLTRENIHSIPDGTYLFLDGLRHTRLLSTDPDLTDFYLPNGNFKRSSFEALSYITDERKTEDGSAYTLPVEALPASETAASPNLDVVGNVFSNIPPRYDGYISRPALESELSERLQDDRHPVITLQGRGGVGKTSLALEVLHRLAGKGDVFAMIWFSARDIDLLSEGPRVVRADVLSLDDVSRDFANLMQLNLGRNPAEARRYFSDCLSGRAQDGPFLFVLDNFETIREQGELYSFLSNAVRLPNKVLITTRTRDFKADFPIEVRGMQPEEFTRLVRDTAARLGIASLITPQYEEELYAESDGHPYIAKVLLGEVARERRRVSVKRVVASNNMMLDALFDRTFESLSPVSQRVFLTLCSWRSLVSRIGLQAVLLRPENERLDVEHALTELEQSSLVEVIREDGTGDEFLSVPLAASIFGSRKLVTSPLKTAIEADLEIIRMFGAMTTVESKRGFGPRVDRLARAAAQRADDGGDLTQEIAVLEFIAAEYSSAWLTLADLKRESGSGDLDGEIRCVKRYLESRPKDHEAWNRLINLYRDARDNVAEVNARLQLVELTRPSFFELSSTASRLTGMLSRREIELGADERRLMIRKLRSLIEARSAEADATDLSRLAWLCIYDQDTEAAGRWVMKGLEQDPENRHCASLRRRLAMETEAPST